MKLFFFSFVALFCSSNIFGQNNTILQSDTMYLWEGNREFIKYADSFCTKLSSRKKDSLMLFYDFDSGNNIIVISKRNKKVNCFFIHQSSRFEKTEIKKIENPVFVKTDISKVFETLNRIDIKLFDTSRYSSGNGMVYCKFYFNKKEKIFSGWYDNFKLAIWDINEYFLAELVKVREEIINERKLLKY